jgi:hypothetical protein
MDPSLDCPNSPIELLTVLQIVEVMNAALGEPPDLPLGCARLLTGCLNAISTSDPDMTRAIFALKHRDLIVKWMLFLSAPRSMMEFKSLYDTLAVCRCNDGPAVLRAAPETLHIRSQGSARSDMLIFVIVFFKRFGELIPAISNEDARALFRKSRQPTSQWPANATDIMPWADQPVRFVHMIAQWSFVRYVAEAPVYTFARMISGMMRHLRATMVPGLLRTPLIWNWLMDMVQCSAAFATSNHSESTRVMLTLLEDGADLLSRICESMFDEELIFWATSDGQRTLLHVLEFASDGMQAVSAAFESRLRTSDRQPGDAKTGQRSREYFADFALRILKARPDLDTEAIGGHMPKLVKQLKDEARQRSGSHWKVLNLTPEINSSWTTRCWSPDCLKTWAGVGRLFQICTGCKMAGYCSRTCQRSAWRHAKVPHRDVCSALWTLRVLYIRAQQPEAPVYIDGLRKRMGVDTADAVLQNMTSLCTIKSTRMSGWTRRLFAGN